MKTILTTAILAIGLAATIAHADRIELTALADSLHCKFTKGCDVSGKQYIHIENDSNLDHNYHYVYSLCMDTTLCQVVQNDVIVRANSVWDNMHPSAFVQYIYAINRHPTVSRVAVWGHQNAAKEGYGEVLMSN